MIHFYEDYYEEDDEELTPEQIASHEEWKAENKRRSDLGLMSDVQEAALRGVACYFKMEPKQMIIDRLGKEVEIDELKYDDAVLIIKHYNNIAKEMRRKVE